ncbi:MAG: hypothetical protein ACTH4Y_08270 [Microbacterium gubbeenense]|uniref:hypothetical protein n=1 Tax=Microbacterium gubbeenense TaxID=159896 RepID=UPI003F96D054
MVKPPEGRYRNHREGTILEDNEDLFDQIVGILHRHIRMDPEDEGDPGEAATRILVDIIAPLKHGNDR